MYYCLNHPLVETQRYCSRCKKPACADCLVPLKGQDLCAECKHATLAAKFKTLPINQPATSPSWAPPPASASPTAAPATGETAVASPPWSPQAPELTPEFTTAPVLGNCSYHSNSPAYTTCERCGDFTCALCVTAFDGRNYCVRCVDLMWQRGTLEASRFTDSKFAFGVGIFALIAWIVPFYGFIPGVIAFGLGWVSLRKIAAQPELPGKQRALAGLIMGLLGMLLSVGFWAWILTRGWR